MWKVNAGFALALAALGLCALGTYDSLRDLYAIHGKEDKRKEADRSFEDGCNILLASGLLSVIVIGLSAVVINRDMRGRQEAEVRLVLAHANLDTRVRERTADLARANEELRHARDELDLHVRERTADLARANAE